VTSSDGRGPLAGVRVLDFSRVLSGPFATMCLADLGADVVKVELPHEGDDTRRFGPPFHHGVSTYFLAVNRGKRSIALDLKSERDRATARALARVADVAIENFRPGVMARLGLDAATLRGDNPRLVYCSISGFGQADDRGGYDLVIQGMSGIPALTGEPAGGPTKDGASMADLVAGHNAVQAILAALYRRERTGEGAFVDLAMLPAMAALLVYHATGWLNGGTPPRRWGNQHPSIHPYGTYEAADGWFNLAVGNDAQWRRLERVLAQAPDPRFARNVDRVANRQALDALLVPALKQRPIAAWGAILEDEGVPWGPILTPEQALERVPLVTHEHPTGGTPVRTTPLPYSIDGAPTATDRRAPNVGEHGDEIVRDWLGSPTS
jgi:crotonobetainyl-CoA:carnitine CoA-transferase CaiB-like acyl-CoA transferase